MTIGTQSTSLNYNWSLPNSQYNCAHSFKSYSIGLLEAFIGTVGRAETFVQSLLNLIDSTMMNESIASGRLAQVSTELVSEQCLEQEKL